MKNVEDAGYPPPLVTPDVDLRDFYFMPLDVCRLRDSRLAYAATGEGFRSAVLLWCACWHQLPAASLPDDDIELAHLAGFGRVVSEWLRFKEEALHGFIKCSDGRIYHPHIASEAMKSWREKQLHRWAKECDRIRKENKSRKTKNLELLPFPEKPSFPKEKIFIPTESENFPPEKPFSGSGIPPENALKGQGQGKERDCIVLSSADADATTLAEKTEPPGNVGELYPPPVLPDVIPEQPESPPHWAAYFVNVLGFSLPEAMTVKTLTMFKSWVDDGVTRAMVETATLAVRASLAAKGQDRPSSPMYYKNFVKEIVFKNQQPQKSPVDRASQQRGLSVNTYGGNYDTERLSSQGNRGPGKKLSPLAELQRDSDIAERIDAEQDARKASIVIN
jgi:hypothetical protein